MNSQDYKAFTRALQDNLEPDPRVQGLVLMGSTAETRRAPDMYSDHDFFVITEPGAQSHFRSVFDWLPNHTSIVLTVNETEHGLKVLYASGHLLEFAVFDIDEMKTAKGNDYAVAFDRGEVTDVMRAIAVTDHAGSDYNDAHRQRDLGLVPCLLVVGLGRVARGEAISGQVFIRTYALSHLLPLLTDVLPGTQRSRLDNLDPFRRFEQVFPEVGTEINAALSGDPVQSAQGLLDVYDKHLSHLPGFPKSAVTTVRDFISRCIDTAGADS